MRICYFGDGTWATIALDRLLAEGRQIVGVVVRRAPTDPGLLARARELGLPLFQPENVNDAAFLDRVRELQPDLNLSVSYDQILRRAARESAPMGFVNFHAGRLPCYRGRGIINWAIINGESEIGLTAHFVDAGIDTGDIVLQRALPIAWTDTYGEVLPRVQAAFPQLVSDAVHLLASGRAVRRPQAHLPGTYFAGRREGDEWLDWAGTSRDIYNKVRGITRPGPGARTLLAGRAVVVWSASYDPTWPVSSAIPGEVVGRRAGEGVFVKTGDSTLFVREIQAPGDSPVVPTWSIGTRLGPDHARAIHALEARVARLEQRLSEALRADPTDHSQDFREAGGVRPQPFHPHGPETIG